MCRLLLFVKCTIDSISSFHSKLQHLELKKGAKKERKSVAPAALRQSDLGGL